MNRLRAAILPVSFCTSFLQVGEARLRTDLIFSGFALMPRFVTMCPRNLPEVIEA